MNMKIEWTKLEKEGKTAGHRHKWIHRHKQKGQIQRTGGSRGNRRATNTTREMAKYMQSCKGESGSS